jgi:hypothetical protein
MIHHKVVENTERRFFCSLRDNMETNGKDLLIEEIDRELREIDVRLKKVLSKTDALLKESTEETKETEKTHNDEESRPS